MSRALLAIAACFCLTCCAPASSVKKLDTRMAVVEQGLAEQGRRLDAVETSSRESSSKLVAVEARVASNQTRIDLLEQGASALRESYAGLSKRVTSLERYISWSGRFSVTIEPDKKWHVLYANSTGESQTLRVRKTQGVGTTSVRVGIISRIAGDDAGGIPAGVEPPSWDMSGVGSQRWLRLGCGQDLSGKAEDVGVGFDILVSRDPNPVKC